MKVTVQFDVETDSQLQAAKELISQLQTLADTFKATQASLTTQEPTQPPPEQQIQTPPNQPVQQPPNQPIQQKQQQQQQSSSTSKNSQAGEALPEAVNQIRRVMQLCERDEERFQGMDYILSKTTSSDPEFAASFFEAMMASMGQGFEKDFDVCDKFLSFSQRLPSSQREAVNKQIQIGFLKRIWQSDLKEGDKGYEKFLGEQSCVIASVAKHKIIQLDKVFEFLQKLLLKKEGKEKVALCSLCKTLETSFEETTSGPYKEQLEGLRAVIDNVIDQQKFKREIEYIRSLMDWEP
eukprot:TRINITY_DN755_c0_g1_i1.p3 TRINITY_DN755_c0_g1~~TRINITY_DN755_c0_g1_i1.p3  ORF type:complete len:308 (-),score=44.78 TRINITY_DN755_c0_g1_i1:1248-2129(-)